MRQEPSPHRRSCLCFLPVSRFHTYLFPPARQRPSEPWPGTVCSTPTKMPEANLTAALPVVRQQLQVLCLHFDLAAAFQPHGRDPAKQQWVQSSDWKCFTGGFKNGDRKSC
ncbi:unnamed protein product [Eretmochelys imbricata]